MTATSVTGSGQSLAGVSAGSTQAQIRLSVYGPGGRIDLVVPAAATADAVVDSLGTAAAGLVLSHATAAPLDPIRALDVQGVRDGDLLVLAAPGSAAAPLRAESAEPTQGQKWDSALPVRPVGRVLLMTGAVAIAGLAAGIAFEAGALARVGIAAGIALGAVLAGLLPRSGRLPAGSEGLAPAFAAAAVIALLPRSEPGADVVAIVAAGVVAAQAAALARVVATPIARPVLLVWLWSGVLVAGIGACVIAAGGEPRMLWAVLALLALSAARLLPQIAVDVPDEQLLDADRMSATTWTARVVAPARRVRVRTREVGRTVESGRRLLDAGALAAAVTVGGTAVALAIDPGPGWTRWLAFATGGSVGVALASCSRSYRGLETRLVLRFGGLVAVLAAAGGALAASSDVARYGVAGGCVVLAVPVLFAAAALGNGWRSVWWARIGDGVESLAVAAAFPVAMLAAGAFDHFRQLLS